MVDSLKSGPLPRYYQLKEIIRERIRSGNVHRQLLAQRLDLVGRGIAFQRDEHADLSHARRRGVVDIGNDRALADANLPADGIDRVFLTGGSSLVPAVRAIFHRRFASERIETGAELESIAAGLALMGRERDLTRWTSRASS